ncbi:MAG: hypothetical protein H0V81_15505 [Solirubrobacterales bacterium]|nr:hypothetical protein [Solirubrobacterales bacterium]
MMVLAFALAGGSLVFAIFLVIVFFGAAYTLYSKSGTVINAHPTSDDADPGAGRDQDQSGLQNPDAGKFRETFDDGGSR